MNRLRIDLDPSRRATSDAWVVVASLYQARLLRFHSPLRKSCQLEELGRIEAPMPAAACERYVDRSGTSGQPYLTRYQQQQKGYQRFTRQLARWIRGVVREHAIEQITVLASAQMVQWFEQLPTELVPDEADLRASNLMNAYDDALRRDPDILALIQPHRSKQQGQTPATDRHVTTTHARLAID